MGAAQAGLARQGLRAVGRYSPTQLRLKIALVWIVFLLDFGPILGPKMPPTTDENLPKIVFESSHQIQSVFPIRFFLIRPSIFDPLGQQ